MPRALFCDLFKGPGSLRLGDIEEGPPGEGEVAVRVLACGANATDVESLTGHPAYSRVVAPFGGRGRVLGSDVVGIIEALGEGVAGLAPGQRVLADTFGHFGGFADRLVAPAKLWVPVPEDVSDADAAALPQSGTIAFYGMADRVEAGMEVLINGAAGGTGPLAIQMALNAGARVSVVDSAVKLPILATYGPHRMIDFRAEDFAARPERYDLILDLYATRRAGRIARVLKPDGRYGMVGGPVPTLLNILVAGGLRGLMSDRSIRVLAVPQGPERLPELLGLVADARLKPLIGEVAPLADAVDALTRMARGEIAGKLVIRP